jgi:TolB protein
MIANHRLPGRMGLVLVALSVLCAGVELRADTLLVVSTRTGNADVFLIDAVTGDALNLTKHEAQDVSPRLSPDGKKIVFASDRDGVFNIHGMDDDGSNLKQLTRERDACTMPCWSHDGKKIAFSRRLLNDPAAATNIHVMDADGTNVTLIQENAFDPAWSPDGKKIAFASPRAGDGFRLYTSDADGKNETELTATGNNIGFVYPAWPPDGNQLAFSELVENQIEVHVIDADGKNLKQLTMLGALNMYPAWSPDGKKIIFQHHAVNHPPGPVYAMDADGANPTILPVLRSERYVEGGRHVWQPE